MKINDGDKVYYMIYRISKDRHGGIEDFYGWTTDKSILTAFLKQRNKKKYMYEKIVIGADECSVYSKHGITDIEFLDLSERLMINIISLQSGQTGDIVKLFSTEDEKLRFDNDIQRMFDELRSFDRVDDINIAQLVNVYNNIKDKYIDALEYIGYRPKEVSDAFDSIEDSYNMNMDPTLNLDYNDEEYDSDTLNSRYGSDPSKVMIYSLESVIKVLKDELY